MNDLYALPDRFFDGGVLRSQTRAVPAEGDTVRYPSWMSSQMEPDGADEPVDDGHCRSCDAPIYWSRTSHGKLSPFDIIDGKASGRSHFASCPDRVAWRKR